MACCRRSSARNKPSLLKQISSTTPRKVQTAVTLPQTVDNRLTPHTQNTSMLCSHFATQGANLVVDIVENRLVFHAAGNTFDLEDSINLYSCTGTVPTLIKVIKNNVDKITKTQVVFSNITLKNLLAVTIDLLKKESL